jgi:ribonuclease III
MKDKFQKQMLALEERLGYSFQDRDLLVCALTHPSFAHEQVQSRDNNNHEHDTKISHYERLEFLGDAVLDLVISHLLMEKFEDILEGELSRMRASLVNYERLGELAKNLKLGKVMLLGKGELASDGHKKPSILAAVYEAVVGAIYLDGGFEAAFSAVSGHYEKILKKSGRESYVLDYKSRLQEQIQSLYKKTPAYRVIDEKGPQHKKTFEVELKLGAKVLGRGKGKSKKEAEQQAAKQALKKKRFK